MSLGRRLLLGASVAALLAAATPAQAEMRPAPSSMDITMTELQSLSCLGTGSLTATSATVLVILSPLEALSAPLIAAAFAAGCGVGAVASPGVLWIVRRLVGEPVLSVAQTP